jgi:rhamnosyl/mannosyltransferase
MVTKDDVMGGITRHVDELAAGLARREISVEVVAPAARTGQRSFGPRDCSIVRPRSWGRAFSTELSPGLYWATASRRADVVHVHLPNPIAIAALATAPRAPLVATYHCDLDRTFGMAGAVYHALLGRVLRRAGGIVVSSDAMVQSTHLRSWGPRVHVIPLGVEPERLAAGPVVSRVEADLRARFGSRIVLFVGRLVYYKGLDVLLRAMLHVRGELLLVGVGVDGDRLRRTAAQLGLSRRVHHVGFVSDAELPGFYRAATVVVLPSTGIGEAFGLTQVEAALCGRPVVSTRLPTGVSRVNEHGVTGLCVEPGDPRALAAALAQLLDDEGRSRAMGEAARQRALREFTVDPMVERTVALYERVVARSRGAGVSRAE